jgi:hypothetical protein
MSILLSDDGTLDTVFTCSECGEEFRFSYACEQADEPEDDDHRIAALMAEGYTHSAAVDRVNVDNYDAWVQDCIEQLNDEHECETCEHCGDVLTRDERIGGDNACERCWREQNEPQEDDLTTEDHQTFYQDGRKALKTSDDPNGPMHFVYFPHGARDWRDLGTFDTVESAILAYQAAEGWYTAAWWISDHGNAHRIDLSTKEGR